MIKCRVIQRAILIQPSKLPFSVITIPTQLYYAPTQILTPPRLLLPPISNPCLSLNLIIRNQILSRIDIREIERYDQTKIVNDGSLFLNVGDLYIVVIIMLSSYVYRAGKEVCEAFQVQVSQTVSPSPLQANTTFTNPWVNIKIHMVTNVTKTDPHVKTTDTTVGDISTRTLSDVMTQYSSNRREVKDIKDTNWGFYQKKLLKVKVQHWKHHRKKLDGRRRQKSDSLGYHAVLQGHGRMGQSLQFFSQIHNVDKVQLRQQHGWNWTWGLMSDKFEVETGAGTEGSQWDQWTQRPMGYWIPHSGDIGLWTMWRCRDICHIFYVYV